VSGPSDIAVDEAAERVTWREGKEEMRAEVAGAFDARYDPRSDRLLVVTRNGGGAVVVLSRQGERLAQVEPPAGQRISHFADSGGATVVCQGEKQDGHWWDWHFAVDPEKRTMRKTGPAY
jgi:hypothetical protein